MATRRKSARKKQRSAKAKSSLVDNINRRKRAGKSRPKSRSTVSRKAYREMQRGWRGSKPASKRSKRTGN